MADTLVFSSARLLSFGRNQKIGTAKFSSSISAAVQRALGWEEIPDCFTSVDDTKAELHGTECTMVPDQDGMKRMKFKLDISKVSKFEVTRKELEGKKKKGYRLVLTFDVAFTDSEGAAKLEKFLTTAGDSVCKLTVSYVKQSELALVADEEQGELAEE